MNSVNKKLSSFLKSLGDIPEKAMGSGSGDERLAASMPAGVGRARTPKKGGAPERLAAPTEDDDAATETAVAAERRSLEMRHVEKPKEGEHHEEEEEEEEQEQESEAQRELETLRRAHQRLQSKAAAAEAELDKLRAQAARHDDAARERERLQQRVRELQERLAAAQGAEKRVVSLEDSTEMMQQQIAGLKACVQQTQALLDAREADARDLRRQLHDARAGSSAELAAASDRARDLQRQVDENVALYTKAHASLVTAQQLLAESERAGAALQRRCAAADADNADLRARLAAADAALAELRPRCAALEARATAAEAARAQAETALQRAEADLAAARTQAQQSEDARAQAETTAADLRAQLAALQTQNRELADRAAEQEALMTVQTRRNVQLIRELKGELARVQQSAAAAASAAPAPAAPTPVLARASVDGAGDEAAVSTADFEELGVHLGQLAEEKFVAEQRCERLQARVAELEHELARWKSSTVQGYITAQLSRTESMLPRTPSVAGSSSHNSPSSPGTDSTGGFGRWLFRRSASASPSPAGPSTLSDEMMGKMQAIVEDTLVKNIQLRLCFSSFSFSAFLGFTTLLCAFFQKTIWEDLVTSTLISNAATRLSSNRQGRLLASRPADSRSVCTPRSLSCHFLYTAISSLLFFLFLNSFFSILCVNGVFFVFPLLSFFSLSKNTLSD